MMNMLKGKLMVMEGACDGIGKSTQFKLLGKHLQEDGTRIITHHFPSYNTPQGRPVEEYLSGNYGSPKELSPYFINSLYAMDRAITWNTELKEEYKQGSTILLDRYTTSSLIYQAALLPTIEEKKAFVDYVYDYEFNKLQIQKPDQIIFLEAPFEVVTNLREKRKANEGIENDIHERDLEFMRKVYDNAIFLADYLDWNIIHCCEEEQMKTIESIHKEVYQLVKKKQ